MTNQAVKAAQEAVHKSEELDIRCHVSFPLTFNVCFYFPLYFLKTIEFFIFLLKMQEEPHFGGSSRHLHDHSAIG